MNPYNKPSPQDCLAHYGIKGMKWEFAVIRIKMAT